MWSFSCTVQACIVCVGTALLLYFITTFSFNKVLHWITLSQTNASACIGFEGCHAELERAVLKEMAESTVSTAISNP